MLEQVVRATKEVLGMRINPAGRFVQGEHPGLVSESGWDDILHMYAPFDDLIDCGTKGDKNGLHVHLHSWYC